MKESPFPPDTSHCKREPKERQKTERPNPLLPHSILPSSPLYLLPTRSKQRRVQLTTCKHPQYRPHRTRMRHLLPTPSLLRLCRRRRPLPNHLLLLLWPNPNNQYLPRHRHQRSLLGPLPHPDHHFSPTNICLRRHWHRRPNRAINIVNIMEKVYESLHLEYSPWTAHGPPWTAHCPPSGAIPMPTLR